MTHETANVKLVVQLARKCRHTCSRQVHMATRVFVRCALEKNGYECYKIKKTVLQRYLFKRKYT